MYYYKPMTALLNLIYQIKWIPNQWRMAKIITMHKNGTRDILLTAAYFLKLKFGNSQDWQEICTKIFNFHQEMLSNV